MTEPARSFQHYEVLRRDDGTPWELGRGAMGVTYKAFDVNLCCEVALKVVSAALVENPEARERFVREARAAAALRHRNVASVFHLGNDGEHFFYAMEFINGDTLDALVRRGGPLSVENTLRVILQVARALAAAERQHLVHRDIKPANLMVTHEDADEETVVKVIDFGLARPAATAENAPPLTLGGFVGTPQYASPEQLEERPLDARSDIYSLGVTAWFLLTGRAPFAGSLATVCQRQLKEPPPWDLLPVGLPACVRALLGHLLEKDAARRPQNALELRTEIEACLEEVQGTTRKRDLHLPALAVAALEAKPKTSVPTVQTGALLNARYRLLHEIGGRDGVRVFQARDESAGDRLVAIKILPETGSTAPSDLAEEVRLIQAATHPHLAQVLALEKSKGPATMFMVEEWLAGCTVRDLLAARGGALSVVEALTLLEQTAAATDHAARCRLDHLELPLTALHLTLSGPGSMADDGAQVRALLSRSLAEWPAWTLKVRAFRFHHDPAALVTWAGGATLVPGAGPPDRHAGDLVGGRYIQSLATLVYEWLGETLIAHHNGGDSPRTRYSSLPVLNEEANLLLRQALSGDGPFDHGWQLHEALATAVGSEPARGEVQLPVTVPEAPAWFEQPMEPPATHGGAPRTNMSAHESTVTAFPFVAQAAPVAVPVGGESVAGYFHDRNDLVADDPEELSAGSAWDRLSLVADKRAHPGRWLAGVIGLAAVFGLGFVGVLVWLLQQMPPHDVVPKAVAKKRPLEPTVIATSKRPTPRLATPAPLAAVASPVPTPPIVKATPIVVATPAVDTPAPAPTPLSVEVSPTPAETPTPERLATVRVDSIPPGAQIRLGDELLGTTPCRVQLPHGDHELIARYQDWPVTHHTVHVDDGEAHATVEIRLMRPDLVPGLLPPPNNHARRPTTIPAARRVPRAEPSAPSVRTVVPSEPEVRPAQRVLTPFRIDEPAQATPVPPSGNQQPFAADDAGEN